MKLCQFHLIFKMYLFAYSIVYLIIIVLPTDSWVIIIDYLFIEAPEMF